MLHEQKRSATAKPVLATIITTAGPARIEATAGVVTFNGAAMLPHEADMLATELARLAGIADRKAVEARYVAKYLAKAAA